MKIVRIRSETTSNERNKRAETRSVDFPTVHCVCFEKTNNPRYSLGNNMEITIMGCVAYQRSY